MPRNKIALIGSGQIGGTLAHLAGLKAALTRTLNSYAKHEKLLKDPEKAPSGDDFREGLTAVLSIKVPDPQFEGQTKDKLGNREVQGIVESVVGDLFGTYLEEHHQVGANAVAMVLERRADRFRIGRGVGRLEGEIARQPARQNAASPGLYRQCPAQGAQRP